MPFVTAARLGKIRLKRSSSAARLFKEETIYKKKRMDVEMFKKQGMLLMTACSLLFTGIAAAIPAVGMPRAEAAGTYVTARVPANLEKYLFVNTSMVTVKNPHPENRVAQYRYTKYLSDTGSADSPKTAYMDSVYFHTSKKGFLLNLYHFIGILPPVFPAGLDLAELDRQIAELEASDRLNETWFQLRQKRAQLNLQARVQALIHAGYVKPDELDEGPATKEFVATVLYRMFQNVRPYKGSVTLQDTQNTAVRWAVETGLPGFEIDSKGNVYPHTPLRMTPGPENTREEYPYLRLFDFLSLILPGKKTETGWEYYQVQLRPGMVPVRTEDLLYVNGTPLKQVAASNQGLYYKVITSPGYYQENRRVAAQVTPRFAQMLHMARLDATKPRVWDWRRDVVAHPLFVREVAAYRKTKSSQALNAVYQKVRNHYNLFLRQDSPAVIKSVLDHVR